MTTATMPATLEDARQVVCQRLQCVGFLISDGGAVVAPSTLGAEVARLVDVLAVIGAPQQPHRRAEAAPWGLDTDGFLLLVDAAEGVRVEAADWLDGNQCTDGTIPEPADLDFDREALALIGAADRVLAAVAALSEGQVR